MSYIETMLILFIALGIIVYILMGLFKRFTTNFTTSDRASQVQVKSKKREEEERKASWDDIGGYEDVKKEIREYIEFP